jgi:hypothetical protein
MTKQIFDRRPGVIKFWSTHMILYLYNHELIFFLLVFYKQTRNSDSITKHLPHVSFKLILDEDGSSTEIQIVKKEEPNPDLKKLDCRGDAW